MSANAQSSKEERSLPCAECARYESARQVLTLLIDTQRDKIRELEAERDQYKQIAELNAETIKGIQAKADAAFEEERLRSSW